VKQSAPPSTPDSEETTDRVIPILSPELVAEPEKESVPTGNMKILVESITVAGADDDEQEKLASIIEPYTQKELSMAEINEAATTVTHFYRDRGYLVARAYIPKQAVQEGVLTIALRRGRYGQVTIKNSSRLRQRVVRRVFERMRTDSPDLTQGSLERAMMLLKEMPGGTMPNVSIKPGTAPGTTDLNVKVDEVRRFHGYLLGDNEGSQFTGRNRAYGGFDVSSPLGLGDQLSITGMVSQTVGLKNGSATYGIPLNYNGLRFALSYSRTVYTLGGVYTVLGGTGEAKTLEGTFSYPIRRRQDESIDFFLSGAHKDLHDDLSAVKTQNPRNANLATLTVQRLKFGTLFGRKAVTTLGASVTAGQLEVVDPIQRSLSGSDGTYGKLNFKGVAELQLFGNLSAKTSLSTQKDISDKVLDSSEQLFISGSGGIRAYAEGASGDNGYVFTQELRYTLPRIKFLPRQQALTAFFDNGALSAQERGTSATNYVLTDLGAGYSVNFRSAFLNLQAAHSLGATKNHNETDHMHVFVQIGYVF
jgi:hemolysin activation/secretion protein